MYMTEPQHIYIEYNNFIDIRCCLCHTDDTSPCLTPLLHGNSDESSLLYQMQDCASLYTFVITLNILLLYLLIGVWIKGVFYQQRQMPIGSSQRHSIVDPFWRAGDQSQDVGLNCSQ